MRPGLLDLAERSGTMWRSSWTGRGSKGEAVDTATTSGGDGGVRPCAWERDRGEEEHGESERGPEGLRGALSQLQAVGGKQEVASYGHARVGHALRVRLARGGRRLALARWAGPAEGARPGKWPRWASSLSLSFYLFLFSNIL